jgi:hypothetical protein
MTLGFSVRDRVSPLVSARLSRACFSQRTPTAVVVGVCTTEMSVAVQALRPPTNPRVDADLQGIGSMGGGALLAWIVPNRGKYSAKSGELLT